MDRRAVENQRESREHKIRETEREMVNIRLIEIIREREKERKRVRERDRERHKETQIV